MKTASETIARPAARGRNPVRALLTLACALILALAVGPDRVQASPSNARQAVHSFYQVLLNTMREGPRLGAKGRYERLAPAIDRTFDLAFMTETAVGPQWAKFSDSQKAAMIQAFRRYVVATYADNFDDYSGEKLVVSGEAPSGGGRIVETKLVKSDGTPVALNYLMHEDGARWRIRDIYLDGQISELAVRRSQFVSILSMKGTEGLIAMLNQKARTLVPDAGS